MYTVSEINSLLLNIINGNILMRVTFFMINIVLCPVGFNQPMMPGAVQMGANQMPPPYGSQQGTPKMHLGQQQSSHPQNTPGGPQMYPGMSGSYSGGATAFGPNMVPQFNQQGIFVFSLRGVTNSYLNREMVIFRI